jgi:hypothetical protein
MSAVEPMPSISFDAEGQPGCEIDPSRRVPPLYAECASRIDQPPPTPNTQLAVWPLVLADMAERDRVGRHRYGTPLQPHNGRDALADAYAEALDLAVYLRQALFERDGR